MANLLTVAFDSDSLGALSRVHNFGAYLNPEMTLALEQAGDLLTQAMIANTWQNFANPTGALADSIQWAMNSPLELIIQVGVPYAWRMEEGFVGTDSIGRTFNQTGKPYALPALQDNEDQIAIMMNLAAANALAEVTQA